MECRRIVIANKLGLHARAAAKLVQLAATYDSEVVLRRDTKEVNGKSIMGVMMLAAGQGTEIEIATEGEDAQRALKDLVDLVENRFGESE